MIDTILHCVLLVTESGDDRVLCRNRIDMNTDLIKYLYDYCIFKGKTGSKYLESVAIAWQNKEIDTVDKARQETFSRTKECLAVKNSFGLQRSLGAVELEYISKWRQEYGMSPELIKEACDRTLIQVNKPDFKYADRILRDWKDNNVTGPEDVVRLDEAHRSQAVRPRTGRNVQPAHAAPADRFSQFPQRNYSETDYDELERRKIANKKN